MIKLGTHMNKPFSYQRLACAPSAHRFFRKGYCHRKILFVAPQSEQHQVVRTGFRNKLRVVDVERATITGPMHLSDYLDHGCDDSECIGGPHLAPTFPQPGRLRTGHEKSLSGRILHSPRPEVHNI